MQDLLDYLEPVSSVAWDEDKGYTDGQLAKHIAIHGPEMPDLSVADIIITGIAETRGSGSHDPGPGGTDNIRRQLYGLNYWHKDISIADIGNIRTGASLADSYASVKAVLAALIAEQKTVLILGGSHDLMLAQYYAYKELKQVVEATCIDAEIDLKGESRARSENFLMEMLTSEPNLIRHYNHIGFQSYYVHPRMLETMDKLRFDCVRVGQAKENMEEMEPVLRNTHLLGFDISAIKFGDSPASRLSPNGFTGEEACMLSRYAGMSKNIGCFGIYGYLPGQDINDLSAKLIAQMIWYFIDGKSRGKQEAALSDRSNFNEFHCTFTEVEALFLQSKKTGRWWMQLPDKKFIACSYNDYVSASQDRIPERWLRWQERN
jgi:formiminoglutamase